MCKKYFYLILYKGSVTFLNNTFNGIHYVIPIKIIFKV